MAKYYVLISNDGEDPATGSFPTEWKEFREMVCDYFSPFHNITDERTARSMGKKRFRSFLKCNDMDFLELEEGKDVLFHVKTLDGGECLFITMKGFCSFAKVISMGNKDSDLNNAPLDLDIPINAYDYVMTCENLEFLPLSPE